MEDLTRCEDEEWSDVSETTDERAQLAVPPEKVLAPFLKTLKRRRRIKADTVDEECKEFYLRKRPYELLANLEESFADPLKLPTLLNETAELLRVVTSSKSVNLYLTDYEQNIITLCPKILNRNDRFYVMYRIETGSSLAAYVAYTKEYVITGDVLGDARFPTGIPGTDKTVKAALCLPVLSNSDGSCIAVIELYRDIQQPIYDTVNLQICTALCGWVGVAVQQNASRLRIFKDIEIHRYLLSVAQLFYENVLTFNKAISDLVVFSKAAVKADKCTFYLMSAPVPFGSEEVLFAEVYEEAIDDTTGLAVFKKKMKARFPYLKPGVSGYAARTAEVIMIRDAYKDERFDIESDPVDYRTRSVLAVPIKNIRGVIGVLELVNKLSGPYFTEEDVSVMEVFAGYASLICEYEELSKRNKHEDLELNIARELLFLHTKPAPEDFSALKALPVLNSAQMPLGFFRFDWNTVVYEDEIPKYVIFAFLGSELVETPFDQNNLISFTLSVKKSYRPLPYHNFEHAFTAFHFLFNVLNRNKEKFTATEIVSILIAGLCHELDHQGVTNSFLELKNDPIAQLYEEFPQEEHHFKVCCLLIEANDLLSEFSAEAASEIINNIHRLILATNLSFYFRSKREITTLLNEDLFDWSNALHRQLMMGFLMTCAEFSPNFRTFDVIRKNVDSFYKELFAQGDEERTMGLTPVTMMDRTQVALLPDFHLSLLLTVIEPCTEVVVALFPNCLEILTLCRDGIDKWRELISLRGVEVWKPDESYSKEKRSRGPRSTVVSNLSSAKSIQSDQKSGKNE